MLELDKKQQFHTAKRKDLMTNSFKELQQQYLKYRLSVFAMLLILMAALAMVFINRVFTLPVLAMAMMYHLFILRPLQKQYSSSVTQANLELTVVKKAGAQKASEKSIELFTPQIIQSAELMPCQDGKNMPLFRWEIHGRSEELDLTLCDVTIPQSFHLSAGGKKRIHFNSGTWVHLELPVDTKLNLRLLDETSVPTPIRMDFFALLPGYKTVPVHDPDIEKRFVMYAPNPQEAKLPDSMIRNLKSFMEYTPGYIAISVKGSQMDVFVRGRFLARPVSAARKPDQALLDFDPFPELSYIINLARSILR